VSKERTDALKMSTVQMVETATNTSSALIKMEMLSIASPTTTDRTLEETDGRTMDTPSQMMPLMTILPLMMFRTLLMINGEVMDGVPVTWTVETRSPVNLVTSPPLFGLSLSVLWWLVLSVPPLLSAG
jgi:hypothetical protein